MPKNKESTTKFKVDISELRKGMQEARRQIRIANSEFKAATAGMDRWGKSADGISAKLKQLETVLHEEKEKLKLLEDAHKRVTEAEGKNSKGAEELLIKINNQKAAIAKTENQLSSYKEKLEDIRKESEKVETAFSRFSRITEKQEKDLEDLKNKYASAVIVSGKMSTEAKELAKQINELSRELQENKSRMYDAQNAADRLDNSLDHVEDSANDVKSGFSVMKGAISNLIADGFKVLASTVIDTMKTVTVETSKAHKSFQAATGASKEEMKIFKKEMQDLYLDGFGEGLNDIADKMAYVKQATGEVDAKKIRNLTENIMTLEDTFGSDFNETLRGVNNLMTHFGLDAEEAFDLFAKGSQIGLDYTGELGDNIAEYGGNFKQAGYSAEEYFQLLANGTKSGAYNLDKVNDSINEIKNRIGDGTIKENIKIYSKDTQKLFKDWESGKGTMKSVINSIVKDIKKSKNEQKALNMAAIAFGTMGEDANLKVVKSLKSTGKEFKKIKGTMDEVKKVKYDDVETQITELGRKIQIDLFQPLAEKNLPKIKEAIEYAIKNTNKIINVVKILSGTIATAFVVNKVANFTQSIVTMASTFKTLKNSLEEAGKAQKTLNIVQKACPALLIAGIIGLLVNNLVAYAESTESVRESTYKLTEAEKKNKDSVDKLAKSYNEIKTAKDKSMTDIQAEFGYYSDLKKELDGIVDKNGKIKKGYEDRAKFIVNELNKAIGTEIEISDNVIEKYQEQKKELNKLLAAKKAQIILNANEEAYTEAIKNKSKAFSDMSTAQKNYTKTSEELAEAQKYLAECESKLGTETQNNMYENYNKFHEAEMVVEELTQKYNEQEKTLKKAKKTYTDYNIVIENYEGLSSAIISGDTKKINSSLQNMINNFITAKNGTKETLEEQVKNMKKNYKDLQKAVEEGTPGVTKKMVKTAKKMVEKSEKELKKLESKAKKAGEKAGKANADGIKSKAKEAEKAAKKVAEKADKGLKKSKSKDSGVNFVQGFVDGINKKANDGTLSGAVAELAGKTIKWLNLKLDIHSPSKIAHKSGVFFTEGFANGIREGIVKAEIAVAKLAKESIKKTSQISVGGKMAKDIVEGIKKQKNNVKKSAEELSKIYVKTAKTKADTLAKNNKLSLAQEVNFWKEIVKATKKGTNARLEAEKELAKTKKSYTDECKKIDKEYLADVKKVNTQLKEDIQSVIDKYDEKVKSRKESILSELGLFDAFESSTEYSSEKLIQNLKMQVQALDDWDSALDNLENRKIVPKKLIEELQSMGIGNLANIKLIENMSDEDLKEYVKLWKQKGKLAQERAEQENEGLKKTTQKQINDLIKTANKQLDALEKEYNKKLKEIGGVAADQSKSIGKNIVSGLKKGMKSETSSFQKYLNQFFSSITSTAKKALKIHSPSKIMSDEVGKYISLGIADGISHNKDAITKAMQAIKSELTTSIDIDTNLIKQKVTNGNTSGVYTNTENVTKVTNNYEFKQYNTSPKALSRLEIYRQTKNLTKFNFVKGV